MRVLLIIADGVPNSARDDDEEDESKHPDADADMDLSDDDFDDTDDSDGTGSGGSLQYFAASTDTSDVVEHPFKHGIAGGSEQRRVMATFSLASRR